MPWWSYREFWIGTCTVARSSDARRRGARGRGAHEVEIDEVDMHGVNAHSPLLLSLLSERVFSFAISYLGSDRETTTCFMFHLSPEATQSQGVLKPSGNVCMRHAMLKLCMTSFQARAEY